MTKQALMLAIVAAQVALSLPAQSQNFAPSNAPKSAAQSSGSTLQKPATPTGKPGVRIGQTQHPGFSALTPKECRMLGGKTEVDDGGSCKLRMRCTITHANGNVFSSCIDEAE
jgi:hypothetical protein